MIGVFGAGVIASRTILAGVPHRFGAPWTHSLAVVLEAAGLAGMAATTSTPFALVVIAIGAGSRRAVRRLEQAGRTGSGAGEVT